MLKNMTIGFEGSLPFVSFSYVNIVVSPLYVQLCKVFGSFHFVQDIRD